MKFAFYIAMAVLFLAGGIGCLIAMCVSGVRGDPMHVPMAYFGGAFVYGELMKAQIEKLDEIQ